MRLIDSHGHLNADRFADDVEAVLDGARLAGLERILVPGWNAHSSGRALELAARWPWLDASVGVHPHDAAKVTDAEWGTIEAWARDERVVGIGETGLDSDRMFSPWDAQLDNLRANLALALATGKPAILHCRSRAGARDAQDALVDELRAAGFDGAPARAAFGDRPAAVIHSFSGPVDYAETVIAMGLAVELLGPRVPAGRGALGGSGGARSRGAVPRRDGLAVSLAARCAPITQPAGLRGDHGPLGRRAPPGGRGRAG